MKSPSGAPFRGYWDTVLLGHLEPGQESLDDLVGYSAGPDHFFHRPRWPRGVGVNHGEWDMVVHQPEALPDPTRPVPG